MKELGKRIKSTNRKLAAWLLSLCCILSCIGGLPAVAQAAEETGEVVSTGHCGAGADFDKVTWRLMKLDDDKLRLLIDGVGELDAPASLACQDGITPWMTYKDKITEIVIGDGITNIPTDLFKESSVTKVVIGAGVKTIQRSAFKNCKQLTTIDFSRATALESIEVYSFSDAKAINIDLSKCSSLKNIEEYAFSSEAGILKNISLPNGVESLELGCFESTGLESINFPSSLVDVDANCISSECSAYKALETDAKASDGCIYFGSVLARYVQPNNMVNNIVVKDGTKQICANAFIDSAAQYINVFYFPESLISIGEEAFAGMTGLSSICFTGASNLYDVGKKVFGNYSALDKIPYIIGYKSRGQLFVTIGNVLICYMGDGGEVEVPAYADEAKETPILYTAECVFSSECMKKDIVLTKVTFEKESQLKSIGRGAFAGWVNADVTLPDSVEEIGESAFFRDEKMTDFHMPSSLKKIGNLAFYYCFNLYSGKESVTFPSGLEYIGTQAFQNAMSQGSDITTVTLPDSLSYIGDRAFNCCYKIKNLVLPSALKNIPDYCFEWCSGLTTITVPEGVTSIGVDAFGSCGRVTSITLPSTLTNIGAKAFSSDTLLATVTGGANVERIGESVFDNTALMENAMSEKQTLIVGKVLVEDFREPVVMGEQKTLTVPEGVKTIAPPGILR